MDQIRVKGCPLCEVFLNKNINTKLYWPEKIEDIPNSEFLIYECPESKAPIIVYGEHLTTIPREAWGRILYRSRKLFGGGITLSLHRRKVFDHYHCYIVNVKSY